MATIKDVALLSGVSVATVSRVINNSPKASQASRDAVFKAMHELNYHPNANARALAHQNNETLGLIVADVSDPFFGTMVKAVEQVAQATGNFLLIGNGYHDAAKEKHVIEQLIGHRCSGLVVHAKMLPDEELIQMMSYVPGMVLINRIVPGFESRCVALDDRYGSWLATRHLIQEGHKKIGFLCSNHQISDSQDRLQGYLDALQEHNIPVDERLISRGSPDELGGEAAMTELLSRGQQMTAVVCYNDSMAAGALSVLSDNGIEVPQELSLVGFDDVLISRYLRPRLTTVRYPIIAMATQAAELAIALAKGGPLPQTTHMFSPTLVRRHSVRSID
ncbi:MULTISPECIES: HTH-type transcriptional regulator GalR [Aeromonas]|uniref:HTH-type transcriptional regulator GalR n=1 Tax=Aeromonas hydrophila TaxID=644 RepID=A0AAD3UBL0_AERHY|nr:MULTISPECIES: HTH-type transcriptional regulator GalR [Aeromonas]BEE14960.1 transcriptional regulator GalR [Aeromonas veronii]HAT6344673.1 HTH-type transcriptional regulator GalR [Aeromonas hydrophila]HEH9428544.1 HTH-type transcriptional regulator GalR [Aeromonas sobria]MBL0502662.1 HTH-type transcriptional regulator GalR [Aeromonas caviae]MCK2084396.1 HTH-type transcriptional regulator GalR [Aeromonas genomosp. paramedia]